MRYAVMVVLFLLMPRFLVHALGGAGQGGLYLPVFLLVAMFIHGAVATCRLHPSGSAVSQAASGTLQLAYLLTLLSLGTLALGVAGFTFNEVFVRWFPNLGLSFTLLALAGLLCLMAQGQLYTLLAVFGLVAMGCIMSVAVSTLPWPLHLPEITATPNALHMIFIAAPVLLGADIALMRKGVGKFSILPVVGAMFLAAMILTVLAFAGLMVLEPARLVSLSVPQMAIGRIAMGNDGRMLMGGAGILCTLGGVVLLLRAATGIVDQPGLNKFARSLLGCILVASMLGLGFSGEELTETILSFALGLWFAANALTCLAAMKTRGGLLPFIGLLGSLCLGTAWVIGSFEHWEYAPMYLEEFLHAHGL